MPIPKGSVFATCNTDKSNCSSGKGNTSLRSCCNSSGQYFWAISRRAANTCSCCGKLFISEILSIISSPLIGLLPRIRRMMRLIRVRHFISPLNFYAGNRGNTPLLHSPARQWHHLSTKPTRSIL